MKREKLFDPKCYDLASAFLEDEQGLFTDARCNELAAEIQQAIEDFMADARAALAKATGAQS